MRDIVKEYQKKFRRNHQRARRYTALLLALALTTSLFVNWQLHGVGIAKTADYLCGELEHEHTAACYTSTPLPAMKSSWCAAMRKANRRTGMPL